MSSTSWQDRLDLAPFAAIVLAILGLVALSGKGVPVGILALGLVGGSLLAVNAVGIVVTSRASGFLNLAQLAIGAVGGTLFAALLQAEAADRLLGGLCATCDVDVPYGVEFSVAAVLAILVSAGVGWLMHVAVVRPLRDASPTVLVVASVFVIQLIGGLRDAVPDWIQTQDQALQAVIGGPVATPFQVDVQIAPARFGVGDVGAVVLALALSVLLAIVLGRSAAGRRLRAASVNADRASTLGIDVGAVQGQAWMIAGALSGMVSVLTAVRLGESAIGVGLQAPTLIRLLAIVVLARRVSVPRAVVGGLLIGVLDQSLSWVQGNTGTLDALLVVIIAVTLLSQRADGLRADDERLGMQHATREYAAIPRRLAALPEVVRARAITIGVVAVVLLGIPWVMSAGQTALVTSAVTTSLIGLSVLVLTGWTGQVSLGQFALAAVGGYVTIWSGLPLPIAIVLAMVAGALVAGLVGLPALRLPGSYLAATTLALTLSVTAFLLSPRGLGRHLPTGVDRPVVLGFDLDDQRVSYYLAVIVVSIFVVGLVGMRRSRAGRAFVAVRDNEAAAASMGVDLTRTRIAAFMVSGAVAGAGGSLLAVQQGGVSPEAFGAEASVTVFLFAIIGGMGGVMGPLLGAALAAVLALVAGSDVTVALLTGIAGLVLLRTAPGGLLETVQRSRNVFLARVALRRRMRVPGLIEFDDSDPVPIEPLRGPGGVDQWVPPRYRLGEQWAIDPKADEQHQKTGARS